MGEQQTSATTVDRVLRVPLKRIPDETWRELRRLAYYCAAFGNVLLSEQYVLAKAKHQGQPPPPELKQLLKTYTDWNEVLAAAVRDAMNREVVGIWRRLGRQMLKGEQTLARFSADRALVVRGSGVSLLAEDGQYTIRLRLKPKPQPTHLLPIYLPHRYQRKRYYNALVPTLRRLQSKEYPITKATVMFARPGRKIFVLLGYRRPLEPCVTDYTTPRSASLYLTHNGTRLWLKSFEHTESLTAPYSRILHMKEHFAGIRNRLQYTIGKRKRRHRLRQALAKAGTFSNWVRGPLHELSRHVIDWCIAEEVNRLAWEIEEELTPFPWTTFRNMLTYKAEEAGITFVPVEIQQGRLTGDGQKRV